MSAPVTGSAREVAGFQERAVGVEDAYLGADGGRTGREEIGAVDDQVAVALDGSETLHCLLDLLPGGRDAQGASGTEEVGPSGGIWFGGSLLIIALCSWSWVIRDISYLGESVGWS